MNHEITGSINHAHYNLGLLKCSSVSATLLAKQTDTISQLVCSAFFMVLYFILLISQFLIILYVYNQAHLVKPSSL